MSDLLDSSLVFVMKMKLIMLHSNVVNTFCKIRDNQKWGLRQITTNKN
jgi:hypothetical protein